MRIASTVQNNIWWNYVDQEEYFEMAEGDGRRYLPDVPRPHSYEMKEFDYHVSEICDFLQTFTVLIVSVAGSIIAVFLFYKHKLKCPIEELELASRQVGRNNLDFHITYENEDEMGGLCKEFERMRGQLAENNQQLWKMLEEEKALRAAIAHVRHGRVRGREVHPRPRSDARISRDPRRDRHRLRHERAACVLHAQVRLWRRLRARHARAAGEGVPRQARAGAARRLTRHEPDSRRVLHGQGSHRQGHCRGRRGREEGRHPRQGHDAVSARQDQGPDRRRQPGFQHPARVQQRAPRRGGGCGAQQARKVRYFVIYLAAINILTFCVYGADKRRARIQGARRVPEKTLFALALLLGSAGALFAMRVFHHKTRHWYFKFGIPAILLTQIAAGGFLYVRFFAA